VKPQLLIAFSAAVLLGGCATIPADMEWVREDTDDAARLVLHRGWVIERPVALACEPGSGAVELTLTGLRRDGAVIEIHSGKVWNRYAGAGLADDGPDAPLEIRTVLNAEDPVLTRLGDTGELILVQGEVKTRTPNAFAPAHDFLQLCRRR